MHLPSLRERPEDIQPLVTHFQEKFEGQHKTFLMKTIRYLERYSWHGNVRELENEMEKLIAVVTSNKIEPQHLSSKFFVEKIIGNENEFDCTYEEFLESLRLKEKNTLKLI